MEKEPCLHTNPLFQMLVAPLPEKERLQKESQSIESGKSPPLYVWRNAILIDYEIHAFCRLRGLPLNIVEMPFQYAEEATVWICRNQLQRTDIPEAMEKYLIGKRYQAEKDMGALRVAEARKAVREHGAEELWQVMAMNESSATEVCKRIGQEYHLSCGTVRKYRIYAAVLDQLYAFEPAFVQQILQGEIHISHESLVEISKKRTPEIRKIMNYFLDDDRDNPTYLKYRAVQELVKRKPLPLPRPVPTGSIKEMPAYDPDAEVVSLALTIPSWVGSIHRTRTNTDYSQISERARNQLLCQLHELVCAAERMLIILKEAPHG